MLIESEYTFSYFKNISYFKKILLGKSDQD